MREILFRGAQKVDGCKSLYWYEGSLVSEKDGYTGEIEYYIQNESGNFLIVSETVGQYTGLKDKNGNKIFEGDILKFDDEIWSSYYTSCGTEYDSWETENYGVVGFDEDLAKYDFVKYKYNENSVEADLHENNTIQFADFVKDLEIIGNIHDNPELLKEVK